MSILPSILIFALGFQAHASKDPNDCLQELLARSIQKNVYSRADIGATNDRSWQTYRQTLAFRWHDWNGKKLIIDLGAGQGVAMKEAVESGAFERAVAIDFHDHTEAGHWMITETEVLHRVVYEQGAAETILPKYFSAADVIVDNYGAFTYSSARLHLLESAYRALRPGGRAYIRTPPVAFVIQPDRTLIPLGEHLSKKYPQFFSVRFNESWSAQRPLHHEMVGAHQVLIMTRSKSDPFPRLTLTVEQEYFWTHPQDKRMKFPVVIYRREP